MKLWLDAHLSPEIAPWLGSQFRIAVDTLRDIGLRDADDNVLFDAARRFGSIAIMTKDDDLVKLVGKLGPPPHIIWLRCGNTSNPELWLLLTKEFQAAWAAICNGAAIVEIPAITP